MKQFKIALKACLNYMHGKVLMEPNKTKIVDEVVDEYANELFSLAQVLKTDDTTHSECDTDSEHTTKREFFISGEVIIDTIGKMPKTINVGKVFDVNCSLEDVENFFSSELLEITKNYDRISIGTGYNIHLDNIRIHNYAK